MTKAAALHSFFGSFGMTAYPTNNVPDETVFPWLTYEVSTGGFGEEIPITVHLYFHTTSEAVPNAKVEEINSVLKNGGKILHCDDGVIWVKRGLPFCISQTDASNPEIKHRAINIMLEYLTA